MQLPAALPATAPFDCTTPAEMLPRLSVVVVCRDAAAMLGDTLTAIAAQEYAGWWEVLVVDNGSTDETAAIAASFADRLPNFGLVSLPDPGCHARGLNAGFAHAHGDAYVLLDSDDLTAPGYLLHMGRALATAPFVAAAMDKDLLNPAAFRDRRRPVQAAGVEVPCGYLPGVVSAAMGVRREVVEAVGGFDENLHTQADLDFSWRANLAGYRPTFVPDAVLHYRYRGSLRATFRQEYRYGLGEVVLYRKFRDRGMRRRTMPRVAVAYVRMLAAGLTIVRRGGPARFMTRLGQLVGRARGSLRYRILYL